MPAGEDARMLYISHFLSTFGDRMWQFAVPMLMMDVWTDTLLPSAITGFTVAASCVFFMPYIGSLIDSSKTRLQTMRVSIYGEASCIVLATLLYLPIVNEVRSGVDAGRSNLTYFCFTGILLLSVGAELTMRAGQIALEKDWAVVLATHTAGEEGVKVRLTRINAIMRNIDLSCKLLGPTAFGFIAQIIGSEYSATTAEARAARLQASVLTLAAWNLLFVPFEYFTLKGLYDKVDALRKKKSHIHGQWVPSDDEMTSPATRYGRLTLCTPVAHETGHAHNVHFTDEQRRRLDEGETVVVTSTPPTAHSHGGEEESCHSPGHTHSLFFKQDAQGKVCEVTKPVGNFLTNLGAGWALYVSNELFPALFGFCLLYFTVLDGGTLMTAYLKLKGIPEGYLGLSRGAGAVMGIVGTTLTPLVLKLMGQGSKDPVRDQGALPHAGQVAVWGFWIMLTPIGLSFVDLGTENLAAWVMLGCVTLSRTMLWMFDNCISQLMQERVPEEHRGKVAGTQAALFNVMLMGVGIIGMIFSSPYQFEWLVVISVANVFISAILYSFWYSRQEGYRLVSTLFGKEELQAAPKTQYATL
eukprot:Hpha_TRINITY_DN16182_c1_g5::TRINITY_DN16182_c1_g5_i1::g.8086::m.8086/K14685/SLC40A1, FPN1; solute carrier family 40 (iron-regulated transporter), member 1